MNAIPYFSYQKAGNDLLNQFFTILLPKVYHANIYLLTTWTYPQKILTFTLILLTLTLYF